MRARTLTLVPAAAGLLLLTGCGGGSPQAAPPSASDPAATASSPSPSASASPSRSTSPAPAANGLQALSGAAAVKRARSAFVAAPSVRVSGSFKDGKDTFGIDMTMGAAGHARATISIGSVKVGLLMIGHTLYVSGNDALWKQSGGASAANLLRGKYLRTTTSDKDFEELSQIMDRNEFARQVFAADDGKISVVGPSTVNGQPALQLGQGTGRLFVALTGRPYPLKLTDRKEGSLSFTGYGVPAAISAPPADSVVDTEAIGG